MSFETLVTMVTNISRSGKRGRGFVLVELLVFSLLLGTVFGGVIEIVSMAVKCAEVLLEKRNDALAFSSLMAEVRAGAAEKMFEGGGRFASVSGGSAPLAPRAARVGAAAFGAAGDVALSWNRRDLRCREE